eukprot:Blabericola_migrator_1__10213@NODE_570_length_7533_cov_212_053308_g425_i0_p3_GENE_NODE_570_length_7533_cov_212_053308_g425_i0NODE_570_length_7533_cov_212_053308_g425_i0_p3_ORF_typecomplete_len374_score49_30MORN/PF02493_20/0_0024MORN/PF02493_20/0_00011MORN/PF02493_20/0_00014MORN/PF02493_20/0_0017MORN/PF02493_20/0_00047MORN/PF02493_20/6_1e06MORN/PF02493_20/0_053MORN/PF02493_20/1_2e04Tudor_2/PF18104_1/3_7e02Tudor_2/PF18104_1/9_7e02Tudor_2/PF18104_1/0_92Tudor_2/PF18104_1/4_6e02Tudor_2/PF18104_1/6_5e
MGNCQTSEGHPLDKQLCLAKTRGDEDEMEVLTRRLAEPGTVLQVFDDLSTHVGTDNTEDFEYDPPVTGKLFAMPQSKASAKTRVPSTKSSAQSPSSRVQFEDGFNIHVDEAGDRYEGVWKRGKRHGGGRCIKQDGSWYHGDWENDMKHGYGEECWPNGCKYEGNYRRDLKTGQGKFEWSDGSYYKGDFKNDVAHGFGEHLWSNGLKYVGDWVESRMEGWGRMEWPSGCVYDGEFKNNTQHGYGRLIWPTGLTFVGYWEAGRQHGRGVTIEPNGVRQRGYWNRGIKVSSIETDDEEDKKQSNNENDGGLGCFRGVSSESITSDFIRSLTIKPKFSHLDSEFDQKELAALNLELDNLLSTPKTPPLKDRLLGEVS